MMRDILPDEWRCECDPGDGPFDESIHLASELVCECCDSTRDQAVESKSPQRPLQTLPWRVPGHNRNLDSQRCIADADGYYVTTRIGRLEAEAIVRAMNATVGVTDTRHCRTCGCFCTRGTEEECGHCVPTCDG
jgi:hypothetical protein